MNRVERKQLGQLGQSPKLDANKTSTSKTSGVKAPESLHSANTKVLPKELSQATFNSMVLPSKGTQIKVTTPQGILVAEGTLTEPISFKPRYDWRESDGHIKFKLDNEPEETNTKFGPLKIHWN